MPKEDMGNAFTHTPSPPQEGLNTQAAISLKDSATKMTFQRSGVTLAQLLATPIVPRTQTPPAPAAMNKFS